MPKPTWLQFIKRTVPELAGLRTPEAIAEADAQDTHPGNVDELNAAIADPRHQSPMQQQTLMSEKQRIEALQLQQIQQAKAQFPQRLSQQLDLQTHTGMPSPAPENMMAKILAMMARRHGMPRSQEMPGGPTPY